MSAYRRKVAELFVAPTVELRKGRASTTLQVECHGRSAQTHQPSEHGLVCKEFTIRNQIKVCENMNNGKGLQ
jgi:hypothetical protein